MLKKLIKYDILWIGRVEIWYMLAALVSGGIMRAVDHVYNEVSDSVFWLVMGKIALALLIVSCVSMFLNAFMRTAARFVTAFYKDRSYFTHTLPVTRKALYNAKAVSGAAVMTAALLCLCAAVLLAGGKALFAGIKETFPLQGGMAAVLALLLVLEVICLLFAVFFGIVLGYRQNKAKAAWSALFALGLYFAVQSVIMTIVCVFAAAGGDMNMFFRTNAAEIDPAVLAGVIKKIVTVSCAAYAVLTAALFFLGRKVFAAGVDVD